MAATPTITYAAVTAAILAVRNSTVNTSMYIAERATTTSGGRSNAR